MFQHMRTVLLATGALVAAGTFHSLSSAAADPASARPAIRTEPERPASAPVSLVTGASLRAITIGF
jgi:hypothetical protein